MSNKDTRKSQADVTGAYIFFAALYFVQSVGDPTSGLIAQPVRSLLRSWGESPAALGAMMALLAVPWTIKPTFGLLSDFVPLLGSRRRSYLLVANGLAATSLLLLALVPLAPGSRWLLFALLLPTTMAIAWGDVIVDALMVERGQPLGLTGRFQSIQWTAANTALLLTGVVGGYVAEARLQSLAFALCGALWLFAFAVAWRYADDRNDAHLDRASLHETKAALLGALRDKLFLAVCALLILWSFNPVWGSVLYLHMTEGLRFSRAGLWQCHLGLFCRFADWQHRLWHLLSIGTAFDTATSVDFGGYRVERRLRAVEQLDLGLRRLRDRRSRLHDRHSHSIGFGRADHSGKGCGDGVRNHYGADQLCWFSVRSIWWMAIRSRKDTGTRCVRHRCRDERCLGRKLLAFGACTSSRRSSMVGLAIELTTNAHAIEEPTGKGMASDRKTIIRVTGEHAMSRVLITGANRGLGLEFAISSASELRRLANTSEDKPDDGTGCYGPGTHDPIALKQWFIRQEMANATEHGLLVSTASSEQAIAFIGGVIAHIAFFVWVAYIALR